MDKFGRNIPNYHYEDLQNLLEHYEDANSSSNPLANPAVIVDANHSNSGKKFEEQIRISKDVLHSCKMSADIHKLVKGLMIESYIEEETRKLESTAMANPLQILVLAGRKQRSLFMSWQNCGKCHVPYFDCRR